MWKCVQLAEKPELLEALKHIGLEVYGWSTYHLDDLLAAQETKLVQLHQYPGSKVFKKDHLAYAQDHLAAIVCMAYPIEDVDVNLFRAF